jgi:cation diffusion facilitator CzcD-associated flavoprotein CzcO
MNEPGMRAGVDLGEVRRKYREERDKRLAGERGIRELEGDLLRYVQDPYSPIAPREPLRDEVEVAILGAGFSGLAAAANMKLAGFDKVRLIDSAGDVGGVWYWNRYPECKCDVDSRIYLPLLEETGYVPTMRYAPAPEILEHARRIARHYDLYAHALFHTTITELAWDEERDRWHVRTDRGDDVISQFVVICNGPMSQVKLPDLPGLDTFQGASFHTARWDYDYTGGSPTDPELSKLNDKRVGFVGTGATGLQCVAPLGRASEHLYLFQRTPSTVGVRNNGPIDADHVRALPKGWQRKWQEAFTRMQSGLPVDEDPIKDGWTDVWQALYRSPTYAGLTGAELAAERDRVDYMKMQAIRDRIDSIVRDRATADGLKPYYNYMCKRGGWHDEYLQTFNRPNVTLVDTAGRGVERVTERGLVANDEEYPLDCIIFGTGFEVELSGRLRLGFDIYGTGGVPITERWGAGLRTFHGLMVAGFPNLLVTPGLNSQAVVTANVVHMAVEYAEHFGYIAGTMKQRGIEVFDVSEEAEAEWVQTILDRRRDRTEYLEACTPGRYNNEGDLRARPPENTLYGGGPIEYFALLEAWRDQGGLAGLRLKRPGRNTWQAPVPLDRPVATEDAASALVGEAA